jgi:hypothetical protein
VSLSLTRPILVALIATSGCSSRNTSRVEPEAPASPAIPAVDPIAQGIPATPDAGLTKKCLGGSTPPTPVFYEGTPRELASIQFTSTLRGPISGASDETSLFLGTADGLWKIADPCSATAEISPVAFSSKKILNVYLINSELYVLAEGKQQVGPATEHTIWLSRDKGVTFAPIDDGLEYCIGQYCGFLSATQLLTFGNILYTNAGGPPNLLAKRKDQASWTVVDGRITSHVCSYEAFEILPNQQVLRGGECPLDSAYLRSFFITADGTSIDSTKVASVDVPALANRNIQFIRQRPGTSIVLAGVEGGILKSDDSGAHWRFVLKYEPQAPEKRYPYPTQIIFPAAYTNLVIVGGFDKPSGNIYLAYSKDNGDNWVDASDLAKAHPAGEVSFLTEDSAGGILVTTASYAPDWLVGIWELKL